MKLAINPMRTDARSRMSPVLENMRDSIALFARVRRVLAQQAGLVRTVEKSPRDRREGFAGLSTLADSLDRITASCVENGMSLLDGRFSRTSPMMSMWIVTGVNPHMAERVYLPTMTAAALGLRGRGGASLPLDALQRARARIDKCDADMRGYESRYRLLAASLEKGVPAEARAGLRLERNSKKHQVELLESAKAGISASYAVLLRIRQLALEARERNSRERQHIQVEVSALVDELDRIASHTSYNRIKLLAGDFSSKSRVASMFVHAGAGFQRRFRVSIATMTAQSLGLKNKLLEPLSVSRVDAKTIPTLDFALKKAAAERDSLDRLIEQLKSAEGLDRSIRIVR